MPRASNSGKRQQGAASHRDTRHENGLVGSAKRSSDKKANGSLDNSARGSDQGLTTTAGQPTPVNGPSNGPYKQPAYDAVDNFRLNDDTRRESLGAVSEMSSESSNTNAGANGVVDGHRQIDVNAMKNSDVHRDSNPFDFATTVLKSLPMQDTLAILIILMHVPSLSLTVIYTMFTFLTFVPPVTTSSGMNINIAEIFEGNSTTPSLVTVLCMDFFFLLIWLFLWGPIQDAVLDFAKPIIAITLGGGSGTRNGPSRGLTSCCMWVIGHHLLRGTRAHWGRIARHIPENWRLPDILDSPLEYTINSYDKRSAYGWIRSALAVHILTQGIVRYIREWYLRREKATASSGGSDPEVGKPPSVVGDVSNDAGCATPDTEAGSQTAHPASTSKKRRKQSTLVRLQQPLWAALASTKIVVVKEYELSHATSETAGSNATDIHNLGNAPFNNQPSQIWISYIGSDEVCFSTSFFPDNDDESVSGGDNERSGADKIDTSKPFYVRVNNAIWQPTRMFPIENVSEESQEGSRWTGDIYGLRPASKYVCEFVDTKTDEILFSTSVRTIQATHRETDGASTVANDRRSLRPDSPATTLKTSIAAAEARLADEKARIKTMRKEYKNRSNALKKDLELAEHQLSSAGNHDEKYKQKIRQQETQKAQAERETQQLIEQLKNFDNAPELNERKKKIEKQFSGEKKLFESAQKSFKEFKSGLEKEVKAKEVEKSNLNTRRNKIATRIAKVENELANIADANNRGLNEAERRNQERTLWQDHVGGIETNYNERLQHVRSANAAKSEHIRNAQLQLQHFHEILNSSNEMAYDMGPLHESGQQHLAPAFQLQASNATSSWNPNPAAAPHYPAGLWHSSHEPLPSVSAPVLPTSSAWQFPPTAPAFEPRATRSRGRSSSMLSNISGFTQSSGEDVGSPPMDSQAVKHIWASRTGAGAARDGSSGSGSISNGDPTSPR